MPGTVFPNATPAGFSHRIPYPADTTLRPDLANLHLDHVVTTVYNACKAISSRNQLCDMTLMVSLAGSIELNGGSL